MATTRNSPYSPFYLDYLTEASVHAELLHKNGNVKFSWFPPCHFLRSNKSLTVRAHPHLQAFLEATILTAIPVVLRHLALLRPATRVAQLFPYRSLKEPFAALTANRSVVSSWTKRERKKVKCQIQSPLNLNPNPPHLRPCPHKPRTCPPQRRPPLPKASCPPPAGSWDSTTSRSLAPFSANSAKSKIPLNENWKLSTGKFLYYITITLLFSTQQFYN